MRYMNQEGHVFLQASIFQPYAHIQNLIKKKIFDCVQHCIIGLPRWLNGKESICQCRRHGFDPWARKIP